MSDDQLADIARLGDIRHQLLELDARADHLRRDRVKVIGRLRANGMSHADIALLAGVTRQRVHQWAEPT